MAKQSASSTKDKAEASMARKGNDDKAEYIDNTTDDITEEAEVVTKKPAKTTTPSGRKLATRKQVYYRVRKGDTLRSIARRHGITVKQLCRINGIRTTTKVKVGRSLRCS